MIEVEYAEITLPAVDAASRECVDREAHVPLVRCAPPRPAELAVKSAPAGATSGSAAVAVGANHLTAGYLDYERGQANASPYERRHLGSFLAYMVELENDRIRLTTAHA